MPQPRSDDVIVVGGGIIGCAIAREAAHAGLSVGLLEMGLIGGQSSGAAAGLVGPQIEAAGPDPILTLGLASRDLYPEFAARVAEESGLDPCLTTSGTLVLSRPGAGAAALDRQAIFQRSLGLSVERLHAADVRRLEPCLAAEWSEGLYLPRDQSIDNVLLMQGLKRSALAAGVRIQERSRVESVLVDRGRVAGVACGGSRLQAPSVVIAAGAWSAGIAGVPGLPTHPVRGQMVCLGPSPVPARPLYTHGCYLVPRRDGRVLCGSTMERAGFDATVTGEGLAALAGRAIEIVPALGAAPFHSAWAGLRPATPDDRPAIGPGSVPGLFYACGHLRNGILLAPITARLVTRLLRGEDPGMAIALFDPRRFLKGE